MESIANLRNNIHKSAHEHNAADHNLRIACLEEAGRRYPDGTALDKVMEYLRLYDRDFSGYVCPDLYFAGAGGYFRLPGDIAGLRYDIGHYCPDYAELIERGVDGLREKINAALPSDETGRKNKSAFLETLDLFISYMYRHAQAAEEQIAVSSEARKDNLLRISEDIRYICAHKPSSFIQGLQLIWFAHCYIHLKPYTDTITLGNLDRTLNKLYTEDIRLGKLDRDKARAIICHFYLAFETIERDTQNIVLGGSDENGNCAENELTRLFLQAQTIVHKEQPSVSLKIRRDTSDDIWEDAMDLLACGGGMPAFLNDSLLIEALKKSGFDEKDANTFCNVGCYEATPYGNTFGGTISGNIVLAKEFSDFFAIDEAYNTFETLRTAWRDYLKKSYIEKALPKFADRRKNDIDLRSASPFCACIMDGCVEKLRLPEQYGAKNNIFSVLFGGIGTLVDSLLCIKHFVYDTRTWTLQYLRKQTANNFPDESVLYELRAYPKRFGSGDPYSNELASSEARFMHELVRNYKFDERVIMLPALFIFTGDIYTRDLPATPDGRRIGDRYSYGASAGELLQHRDITKVLISSASLPMVLFPIGAPQMVNLMADLLKTQKGRSVVRHMVETYLNEGGTHIQVNIANPDVLLDAQRHPEQYTDLLIRISGHTEPFVRLNKTMQDALIARARLGC